MKSSSKDEDLNPVRSVVSMDLVPCTRDMECFDTRSVPSSGGIRGKEKKSISQKQLQPEVERTSDRYDGEAEAKTQSKSPNLRKPNLSRRLQKNRPEVGEKPSLASSRRMMTFPDVGTQ